MALVIDESILQQAQALVDQHDVVGAWGVLAAAGDSYAAKAEVIVGEWEDPQSIFAMMVDVQWARAGVSDADKQTHFMLVAERHLQNYLDYINRDVSNRLPKTDYIEASYRDALESYGLPAAAAIDSIFSAADLQLENEVSANVEDLSWGTMLGMEPERIVYDSDVFSDQPGDLLAETTAIGWQVALKYDLDAVARWEQARDSVWAAGGEAVPQAFGKDVEALGRAYQLLSALDPEIVHQSSVNIANAASNRDDADTLLKMIQTVQHVLDGSDSAPMSRDETVQAAAQLIANDRGQV